MWSALLENFKDLQVQFGQTYFRRISDSKLQRVGPLDGRQSKHELFIFWSLFWDIRARFAQRMPARLWKSPHFRNRLLQATYWAERGTDFDLKETFLQCQRKSLRIAAPMLFLGGIEQSWNLCCWESFSVTNKWLRN